MIISIINNTDLHHQDVQDVLRAVNRQLQEDFRKYWHKDVEIRLEGWTGEAPNKDTPLDMRGDAIIYLWDEVDIENALGYHALNYRGIPYGFVFRRLSEQIGEPWSVTLSHEVLELAIDPEVNLLAQGPHPDPNENRRTVYHWYELCDAVQTDTYTIDGIEVSNFVLPLYFTDGEEQKYHNDFLGLSLESFGVRNGGYVGFFDPQTGRHETWTAPNDPDAAKRLALKSRYSNTKRTLRRQMAHHDPLANKQLVNCDSIIFAIKEADGTRYTDIAERKFKAHFSNEWKLQQSRGDETEFDIIYKGNSPISFGEAWEKCHQIALEKDIDFVEPSFPIPVPIIDGAPTDRRPMRANRITGNVDHKKFTEVRDWPLKFCNILKAQNFVRLNGKEPGAGVSIGHPDSGFQRHAELDIDRLLLDFDKDFVDDDQGEENTETELRKDGSHGLATASVIMSGEAGRMTGPATAATLVPLRVTEKGMLRPTPVLLPFFGMRRLRDAIDYAIKIDCKVISISLGGLPSKSLQRAIQRAVKKGIIVLAAAGNVVRFVTAPASFDETIAVAGCNIDDKPWPGSCRGEEVDITAPAESVPHAWISDNDPNDVKRGHGTSFAVALTAGVAAMWRSYHADALSNVPPRRIPEIFRKALKSTARQNNNLPRGKFGAGVLDAEALIKAPFASQSDSGPLRGLSRIVREQIDPNDDVGLRAVDKSARRELAFAETIRAFHSFPDDFEIMEAAENPRDLQRLFTLSQPSTAMTGALKGHTTRSGKRLEENDDGGNDDPKLAVYSPTLQKELRKVIR